MKTDEDDITYTVVMNYEEQYSLWPTYKDIPMGWSEVGKQGSKQECLTYINEVWTDMRPLSLRKWMEEHKEEIEAERLKLIAEAKQRKPVEKKMSPTVVFLAKGSHPISTLPMDKSPKDFKESLDRGYVHITFKDTQGGTCLGVKVDPSKTVTSSADFNRGTGSVHIEGTLILDYVRVRCTADISLSNLEGTGALKILEEVTPASLAKEREGLEAGKK